MNDYTQASGQICRVPGPADRMSTPLETRYSLPLPADRESDALSFLEGLGGDAAGAGRSMRRIGIDAPAVRAQYKLEVEGLARQIAERLEAGQSTDQVARWASEQRRQIVSRMRQGSGPVAHGIYEIRDWRKYGTGGRTYSNMVRYYQSQGVPAASIPERILGGATRSNINVNQAMRGASYLKNGGTVLVVVGVAISAARIWNASDEELPRVIGEELGGFIGGGLGAGAGVGICLVFGIATSGWGLLACGVIGGVGGGFLGSQAGGAIADGIYYSDATTPPEQMGQIVVEIPIEHIYTEPPPRMCLPPN
ncbi:MAG: hypothetical protein K5872_19030 [Rhizobiaceae bacterium]|nr:hypothetical protein [Rhizobiaceae bacterium]MCV0408322.1 hypothetical protein [Rhizobiaceae bacterium]